LYPLLKAVRHPFGDRQKAYETHFCGGHEKCYGPGKVVWDANGSSNLNQLKAHIASHVLHKTKEECLKDLPKKTRHFRKVQVSSRDEIRHSNSLMDLFRIMDVTNQDRSEDHFNAVMGAVARLRQIASIAKIDATVGIATEILKNEDALVIFTDFVETAKSIQDKLSASGWTGGIITGETPPNKRQGLVDDFQVRTYWTLQSNC